MAVNKDVSFLKSFVDKSVGHWEVRQEVGLRSVIGPNEEITDVGICKSGFGEAVGLNREDMTDVKASKNISVCSCSGIAEVEARDDLAVTGLSAEVDFVVDRLPGPTFNTGKCDDRVRNA